MELSPNLRLGIVVFALGLVALFGGTLLAIRWWSRRASAADAAGTVVRNSSIPFALQLVNRAIDLAFAAAAYRIFSTTDQGTYDFAALVVVLYLGTLVDWGLTVLATREIVVRPERTGTLFRAALQLRLRLSALALPAIGLFVLGYNACAALGLIPNALSETAIATLAILTLTLLPAAWSSATTALFQARERMEVPAVLNLLTNILSTLARLGMLVAGFGVVGVAFGAVFGAVVGAVFFALALRRVFPDVAVRGEKEAFRPLLREGWPLLLNSLLVGVFFRFDVILLQAYQGAAAVATYTVAYRFIAFTQIIPPVVVNAIFPTLARRAATDREGFERAYAGTLRLLLTVSCGLAMGMAMLSAALVGMLADGARYLPDSGYALAITIWYLPGSFVNGLTQYVVIALGKQRSITVAFMITAVFNLGANLIFLPTYGYVAAALITIASELVLFVPLYLVLRGEGIRPPWARLLWRPLAAAAAMGAVMWPLLALSPILAGVVGALTYGALLLLLGGVGDEEKRLLLRLLRRTDKAAAGAEPQQPPTAPE